MRTKVYFEHPMNELCLRVEDREEKLILRLHLRLSVPLLSDRISHPSATVLVEPVGRFQSCLVKLAQPFVDETDPRDV